MLQDPRTRRLAIMFACQWLHIRDFDQNREKNEKLYPGFLEIRHDLYEESVQFFEDMFRNDGSVLDILNADHTFLNESLARHYGIDDISGDQWRKVNGVRMHGRGGAAVSFGPHTQNFRDIVEMLLQHEAAVVVQNEEELTRFVKQCLEDPESARQLGQRAQQFVASQNGATQRTVALLESLLSS